jgi:SAM-dependent methyltransferase
MPLCNLSRLETLTLDDAEVFTACLTRAGVTREALNPISKLGEGLPDAFCNPIRHWHLRRIEGARGALMRAFVFADPVPPSELASALDGAALLETFIQAGLLVEKKGGFVCPLRLNLISGVWIFTDDLSQGGDAVMGASATTATLIEAAWPTQRVQTVLDVGCGAGTAALLLSERSERSVGVDISQRALTLSRFNALLADAEDVEFFQSDLLSALQGRQFDLIVAQPPFVARPSETPSVPFLHGGLRGDELALELLAQIPAHVAKGGRAVVLVDWPKYDEVAVTDRIRSSLGEETPLDLLVLLGGPKSLDEHVTVYGAMLTPSPGPEYEDYVLTHREHLERMNIQALRLAYIVLRHTEQKPWTRLIEMGAMGGKPTGAQIDRILAVQDLLVQDNGVLLQAALSVPPDARFVEQDARSVRIELPASRLVAPIVTSRAGADLVVEVGRLASVADAVDAIFERFPQLRAGGPDGVLAGVRSALQSGLLELREPG